MLQRFLNAITISAIVFGMALPGPIQAQDKKKSDGDKKKVEKKKSEAEKKKDAEEALKFLDQATELKLKAKSLPELLRVAELCEQAIKKGLDEGDKEFAIELHSASLYKRAEQIGNRIIGQVPPDRRWQLFRRVALSDLDRILRLNDKMGPAHLMRAQLHAMPNGDRKIARKSAEKAVKLLKDDKKQLSAALAVRGRVGQDSKKNLTDLNEALKLDDTNHLAREGRAFLLLGTGQAKQAAADFRRLMKDHPRDLRYSLSLVEALSSQKQYAAAQKIIDGILKDNPDSVLALSMRARLFVFQEKVPEAIKDLSKILEVDPLEPQSLLLRGRLLYEQGKYDDAMDDVENLIRVSPQAPQGYYLRSIIFEKQGKLEDAITDANRLVKMQPANMQWHLQLGELHFRNKQPDKANKLYTDFLAKHQQSEDRWMAYYARADLQLNVGAHKKAIADYEEAMKLKDDSHSVLNNLAWVLATTPDKNLRDGKRSIELSLKACKITSYKRPHILSTLAAGYAEIGDWDTAIKWSAKAVELEKTPDTKEALAKELASYKKKKPWRERKTLSDLDKDKEKKDKEKKEKDKKKTAKAVKGN